MNSDLNDAVVKVGGAPAVARKLKVSHQAVYVWMKRGWAPTARAAKLEKLTGIPRSKMINPKLAKILGI